MPSSKKAGELRIGIDIGGTFTDFVVISPQSGAIETFKLLSTPFNPAEAVLEGIQRIQKKYPEANGLDIIHGSTVATNALLERKGAKTAFVTTREFRDILQIGRQNRHKLYDLWADPPPSLVPDELRLEVDERVGSLGEVLLALDKNSIELLKSQLKRKGAEAVAVCLIYSFLHPEHETAIAMSLREAGYFVSVSSEILPEYREYERCSTTTVNAYVSPVLDRYLSRLESGMRENARGKARLRVMQSNGGSIRIEEARRNGVRCILSGPAGGIVGAQFVGQLAKTALSEASISPLRIITFDMGGTSTDVSLIDGEPQVTSESIIAGCPIRIPVLDIHTIGAGGGSIAAVDLGGALKVGPESAAADPGPACYRKGGPATVTDANLYLGRLDPAFFLGGMMPLDSAASEHVITELSQKLGLHPVETALGVIEVAETHMERALRLISVERGYDPRDYQLLSFGGAGGLHAANLARRLGIRQVIIPPLASTLSAFGMLASQVVKDYSQTIMLPGDASLEEVTRVYEALIQRGKEAVREEGIPTENIFFEQLVDMRYRGQSYELTIPWNTRNLSEQFHQAHERAYGYARTDMPIEIVNLRVKITGKVGTHKIAPLEPAGDQNVYVTQRKVCLKSGWQAIPTYRGDRLRAGSELSGPALIMRPDTTVLVDSGDQVTVDMYGNLIINLMPETEAGAG